MRGEGHLGKASPESGKFTSRGTWVTKSGAVASLAPKNIAAKVSFPAPADPLPATAANWRTMARPIAALYLRYASPV